MKPCHGQVQWQLWKVGVPNRRAPQKPAAHNFGLILLPPTWCFRESLSNSLGRSGYQTCLKFLCFFVVVCLLAPLAFIYCFHSNDSSTQGKVQTFALLWWNRLLSFGHRPTCPERIRVNLTGCDTRCFPWWKRAKQRGSRRQSLWVPSTLEESGDPKSLGTSLLGKVSLRAGLHFCWESCAEVCLAELAWGASSKMSHSSEK